MMYYEETEASSLLEKVVGEYYGGGFVTPDNFDVALNCTYEVGR